MSRHYFILLCILSLLTPEISLAHSPIQNTGHFYNGLLHPLLVPAHLLLLVAIGLFLGQQGPKRVELALEVFAAATIIGLIVSWFSIGSGLEIIVLALSGAISLLVTIHPQIALHWCVAISLFAGLFLGLDSAQAHLFGQDRLLSLAGSGIGICFLALYPMALANYFNKKNWQKIGIRIIGSWIAASSLLVLALSLSTRS